MIKWVYGDACHSYRSFCFLPMHSTPRLLKAKPFFHVTGLKKKKSALVHFTRDYLFSILMLNHLLFY